MDTPVAPGDILLGKYKVERVLGKGGMGIVVAARHIELGELFAIKFLLPSMLSQREALERFLREARAAAKLRSEHVARVHDVGRMDNGTPYMIMEYLDGRDLKDVLKARGPLPVGDALEYLIQVCNAIAEAHALGIVHRDLKPANLFLTRRADGSACVKVLDFGISKRLGPEEADLTGTSAMFGSPLYMSPEQISKTKSVDTRSDIWSLGVLLYELVAGQTPFKAPSAMEAISRILQEEPTPVRDVYPGVTPLVEAIIGRCLRKPREERFQTTGELAKALRDALASTNAADSAATMVLAAAPLPSPSASKQTKSELPENANAEAAAPKRWLKTEKLIDARAVAASVPAIVPEQEAEGKTETPAGSATTAAWGKTGPLTKQPSSRGASIGIAVGIALAVVGGGSWFFMKARTKEIPGSATPGSTTIADQGKPSETSSAQTLSPPDVVPSPASSPSAMQDPPPVSSVNAPVVAASSEASATGEKSNGSVGKPQPKPKTTPPATATTPPSRPQRFDPSDL